MAQTLPQIYYACPCTDITISPPNPTRTFNDALRPNGQSRHGLAATTIKNGGAAADNDNDDDEEEEEQTTFNPHSPRANYVLHPLENLLFCNECHELRCPRCWYEEAAYYYCPNCLFETGASVVKNETNRCTRSCFQCPMCIATLSVTSIRAGPRDELPAGMVSSTADGPFMLSCPQCSWTTLEIGVTFDKSINLHGQLMAKLKGASSSNNNGGSVSETPRDLSSPLKESNVFEAALAAENNNNNNGSSNTQTSLQDPDAAQFSRLASFYRTQIAETSTGPGGGLSFLASSHNQLGFDSPSTLSRLLSTYGVGAIKKQKGRVPQQREALTATEGLYLDPYSSNNNSSITTTTGENQPASSPLFVSSSSKYKMVPEAIQLRVKRSKRCPTCRSPLSKPDEKRHSIRYRIKVLASAHVPGVSLKPFNPHPLHSTMNLHALPIGKPAQFLLTVRNPIFDPVRVSLATPRLTPGKIGHRVTILCPTFDVGANTDVWDEALDASSSSAAAAARSRGNSTQGGGTSGGAAAAAAGVAVAEAGKVWEKGRNWTTVILELVPSIKSTLGATNNADKARPRRRRSKINDNGGLVDRHGSIQSEQHTTNDDDHNDDDDDDDDDEGDGGAGAGTGTANDNNIDDEEEEEEDEEDEELIQIPIHIRLEYETDDTQQGGGGGGGGAGAGGGTTGSRTLATTTTAAPPKELVRTETGRVQREVAFWVVLVVGHPDSAPSSSSLLLSSSSLSSSSPAASLRPKGAPTTINSSASLVTGGSGTGSAVAADGGGGSSARNASGSISASASASASADTSRAA